ncbi:hypothetical protein B0T10DRAFT_520841 [Thelonectria olida]|uniref:Uncharacterized protein n=1 Tax=Thelonectria olida TaxID=1576542 RepID=A0A9P8VX50_9HYPO|nr:hypothetical protein B0T10DRAFT_520841 [Thelonectria olida]
MLLSLPPELARMIAKSCPLGTQASLVCACKRLYETCNPTLYMCDVQNYGSSSVFHAITRCTDDIVALGTLQAAAKGGADFKQCRDFHGVRSFLQEPSQIAVHSPLCLAASRGRSRIVGFLLDRGVSPDGPGGVVTPPLFQAIANKRDLAAAWLASRGASLVRPDSPQNALRAAIVNSLPTLTAYLVRCTSLDMNEKTVPGPPSLVLALRSGQPWMVPHVISLGADVREPIWELCRTHHWADVVGLLNAGSVHLAKALETRGCLDLIVFVATQKVPGFYKDKQIAVIDRIITLQRALESESQGEKEERPKEFLDMLEGLLQRTLSIHRADLPIASVLLRHGVGIRPGIYLELLEVLDEMELSSSTRRRRIVCQHRKLLKSFDFLFSYGSSLSPEKRDASMGYFLRRVPTQLVELVQQLKSRSLSLTAHGLQKLEGGAYRGGQSGSR